MSAAPPPFELRAIDHVVLIVDGLEEAVRWYAEVVGATEEGDLRRYGMVQLRAGASMIDLVDAGSDAGAWARPSVKGGRDMDHLCLEIGPVDHDVMRAHLARHGLAVEEEGLRNGAKGEGYSWYIRDSWGHQIELKTDR
ncbi:MAG: VOC family protein [Alphaproteobacteria bacterium]|nr:VOC family protein [Alphaproteobacteria bacterium]